MARGKGNGVKILKKSMGDTGDINQLFQQLIGDEKSLDPNIIMDKYNRLIENIKRCNKLLLAFKVKLLDKMLDTNFGGQIKLLVDFCTDSETIINEVATIETVIPIYKRIKENEHIQQYLLLCKNLIKYKDFIGDKHNLDGSFIIEAPGHELYLLPFSDINFKFLFDHYLDDNIRKPEEIQNAKLYILMTLNMIFISVYDIYKLITTPDIDIEKFSEVIIQAIKESKKQIPRCDGAFKIIANSAEMLKSNFNDYYKDFVISKNPTIIMENFVLDISKSTNMNNDTMRQFKKIIFHYRQKANSRPKDPKLDMIFENLDKIMSMME